MDQMVLRLEQYRDDEQHVASAVSFTTPIVCFDHFVLKFSGATALSFEHILLDTMGAPTVGMNMRRLARRPS